LISPYDSERVSLQAMDLLRHLRFFVAVADARHFGQAAVLLGMTQPPLSQGIQRLERHLGVRLFDRGARGVRITEAGAALLPRAEELLTSADLIRSAAGTWTETAVVRVGLALDLEGRVPSLVGALSLALADRGVHVRPVVAGSAELVDAIRDGTLDVAVVRHPSIIDGTRPRQVLTLPGRLVTAATETSPQPVRLSRVRLPVVVPPRRHHPAAHDQLIDTLRREGHSGTTLEEDDAIARLAMVAAGRAVRLTVEPDVGSAVQGDPTPLRVRTVVPVPALRRPAVQHDAIAAALEQELA